VNSLVGDALTGVAGYLLGSKLANGFGSATTGEEISAAFPASTTSPTKTVLITGGNTGLGLETCKVLVKRGGYDVVLTSRDAAKGRRAVQELQRISPQAKIAVMTLDLSDLNSVRTFVTEWKKTNDPINILICNAGIASTPKFTPSKQGHELQFATNHLGHFLLVNELKDNLFAAAVKCGEPSRVIMLVSGAHNATYAPPLGPLRANDKIDDPVGYDPMGAYAQSKLCNILMMRELNVRWPKEKVICVALHPGAVFTDVFQNVAPEGSWLKPIMRVVTTPFWKSLPQGCATTVYCVIAPHVVPGEYYADVNIAGCNSAAVDRELGERLWTVSEEMCKSK